MFPSESLVSELNFGYWVIHLLQNLYQGFKAVVAKPDLFDKDPPGDCMKYDLMKGS